MLRIILLKSYETLKNVTIANNVTQFGLYKWYTYLIGEYCSHFQNKTPHLEKGASKEIKFGNIIFLMRQKHHYMCGKFKDE